MPDPISLDQLDIPLDRDLFLRTLIRELAGTLEQIVGYEEAAGYISLVGQSMGDWLNHLYRKALGVEQLSAEQVAAVLVDLKKRIHGGFSVIEQREDRIVLANTACPFEDKVLDRPSMCMMTSNVFGVITAANLDYAKVELCQTIAGGQAGCRVVVYTRQSPESEAAQGREYFRG
ncbi:MAG: methanogen output domain 1-containing protein [Thermodesulfobacteriota bacterium]